MVDSLDTSQYASYHKHDWLLICLARNIYYLNIRNMQFFISHLKQNSQHNEFRMY